MDTFVKLGFTSLIFVIGSYIVFKHGIDESSKETSSFRRPPFISAVILFSSSFLLVSSIVGVIWSM